MNKKWGGAREGSGRKSLGFDQILSVNVSKQMKETLSKLAEDKEVTVSDLVRKFIQKGIETI